MDRTELNNFYDRICAALTNYECGSEANDAGNGMILYSNIVSIINDLAEKLN